MHRDFTVSSRASDTHTKSETIRGSPNSVSSLKSHIPFTACPEVPRKRTPSTEKKWGQSCRQLRNVHVAVDQRRHVTLADAVASDNKSGDLAAEVCEATAASHNSVSTYGVFPMRKCFSSSNALWLEPTSAIPRPETSARYFSPDEGGRGIESGGPGSR
ncbi:thiosulfate sulfurtransferase/rhodanese-like domain-containing protein 2 isoform X1 [Babesia caballi]|uniref:Thiosulfate sulfurtransferase/rhodanese-like domain-containing protein 2 isoform X1 n=1 Tax=Babesia caballi TaxID=5871 RepID=A0AAV4LLY5_BABCB|nr:thiosulfate sulfurtransferase/rhodanese-like domain-containing protein 2 isoform X1 [Babesia caballi]